jgi:hypothetical protein
MLQATTPRHIEFLPAAAFYVLALAAQVSGYTSTTVALVLAGIATIMLFVPGCYHVKRWHLRRKEAGMAGLASWYFIAPCMMIALLAIAGAAYGFGLRSGGKAIPPAPAPTVDVSLFVPKLGTQIAKEDFQKAINDLSMIVVQVDVKISAPIAGNRPLVRKDINGADELVSKLQQAREIYHSAHEQLIGGGEGEFFKKFSLSQKRALLSILPQGSQAIFDKYNRELRKVTVAVLLVQDAERHKEDGALYQRTITNAEHLADDFLSPISELHDWVNVMNQRIDQMSNSI